MDEKIKKELIKNLKQPTEGLLYDLDLLPEQCISQKSQLLSMAITLLKTENQQLREALQEKCDDPTRYGKNVCSDRYCSHYKICKGGE